MHVGMANIWSPQNPGVTPPPEVPVMNIAPPPSEDFDPSDSMVAVEEHTEHTPAPVEDLPPGPVEDPPPGTSMEDGRPLSLTPSQVVTVERVETLQSELTDLVEAEASVSCDGVEGTSPLRSETIHCGGVFHYISHACSE